MSTYVLPTVGAPIGNERTYTATELFIKVNALM